MLDDVHEPLFAWLNADRSRYLTIILTGGGADLPMVNSLADGQYTVQNRPVNVALAQSFPQWLRVNAPNLEQDYERIAVSLGGARRFLINNAGPVNFIGGDGGGPPTLDRY